MSNLYFLNEIKDEEKKNKIESFLNEIKSVCKKHNLSISHEDGFGAFIITDYDDYYDEWLSKALIELPDQKVKEGE